MHWSEQCYQTHPAWVLRRHTESHAQNVPGHNGYTRYWNTTSGGGARNFTCWLNYTCTCRKGCGLHWPFPSCIKHYPPTLTSFPKQNTTTWIISVHHAHLTGRSTWAPYFNSNFTHSVAPTSLATQRADSPYCSARPVRMNNITAIYENFIDFVSCKMTNMFYMYFFLLVTLYMVNIWHMFDMNENAVTWKFPIQKFCKQN